MQKQFRLNTILRTDQKGYHIPLTTLCEINYIDFVILTKYCVTAPSDRICALSCLLTKRTQQKSSVLSSIGVNAIHAIIFLKYLNFGRKRWREYMSFCCWDTLKHKKEKKN